MNRIVFRWLVMIFCLLGVLSSTAQAKSERPPITAEALAGQIHEAVNRERRTHGVPLLEWDPALAEIAAAHSRDMAGNGYVAHVNSAGETPSDRGRRAGYRCRKRIDGTIEEGLAENLCRNSLFHATRYTTFGTFGDRELELEERLWNTPEQIVESTVRSWMESRGHRENLLYPHHERAGIGVVITEEGKVYVTQLFC